MMRLLCFLSVLSLASSGLRADEYWIAYEGNDFPENQGWTRRTLAGGAIRTIKEGALVIDSLSNTLIIDSYTWRRPARFDPAPGELFLAQWRTRIDEIRGFMDLTVIVSSDAQWEVGFEMNTDTIRSVLEPGVNSQFEPGLYHVFEFRSADMRSYELRIDGQIAINGNFRPLFNSSRLAWGDGIQGARSLSHWDYVRFGVVPEPSSALLVSLGFMIRRDQR